MNKQLNSQDESNTLDLSTDEDNSSQPKTWKHKIIDGRREKIGKVGLIQKRNINN